MRRTLPTSVRISKSIAWAFCLSLTMATTAHGTEPRTFDVQGHRGARGLLPENTLAAFAKALTLGVSTLEMDLGVSSDGVVVVTHNPSLMPEITRDATGNWLKQKGPAIHSLTLADIKTFNVGAIQPSSRYAKRFPHQQAMEGAHIPTLGEVMGLVRRSGNARVILNVETKIRPDLPELTPDPEAFVRSVLKVANDEGFSQRMTIQSFDWRTLLATQRIAPRIPTVYLTAQQKWLDTVQRGKPGPSPWMAGLDIDDFDGNLPRAIHFAGGRVWSPYHREITPESLAKAHDLGLSVIVWTVNDPSRMEVLIEMGVDGIITDYPDRLREVLRSRQIPLPAPTPVTP